MSGGKRKKLMAKMRVEYQRESVPVVGGLGGLMKRHEAESKGRRRCRQPALALRSLKSASLCASMRTRMYVASMRASS